MFTIGLRREKLVNMAVALGRSLLHLLLTISLRLLELPVRYSVNVSGGNAGFSKETWRFEVDISSLRLFQPLH
jgi:hypothetical protein